VDLLTIALSTLLPSVPVLIVWSVGLGLTALRLPTHRRSSLLLGAGLLGMMAQRVLVLPTLTVAQAWLVNPHGWSASWLAIQYGVIALFEGLIQAVWWTLVLAGVFVREPEPTASEPNP
jgi:hypothetical protein